MSIDIFGTLDYQSGISEDLINNGYYCTRQTVITVPHAVGTQIDGIKNIGMEFPLDFTYTVKAERLPTYEMDPSGNIGLKEEVHKSK